jgi:hypothetical protein
LPPEHEIALLVSQRLRQLFAVLIGAKIKHATVLLGAKTYWRAARRLRHIQV